MGEKQMIGSLRFVYKLLLKNLINLFSSIEYIRR